MIIYYYRRNSIQKALVEKQPGQSFRGVTLFPDYGIDCVFHNMADEIHTGQYGTRILENIKNAWKICFHKKPFDVVYASSFTGLKVLIVLRSIGLFRKPIVMVVYNTLKNSSNPWIRALIKLFYKGVDRIVLMSKLTYEESLATRNCPEYKLKCVPCGPDLSYYDRIKENSPCEVKTERFISTGREQRDFETLIQAFSQTDQQLTIYTTRQHGKKNHGMLLRKISGEMSSGITIHLLEQKVSPLILAAEIVKSQVIVCCMDKAGYNVGMSSLREAAGLGMPIIITENPYLDVDVEKERMGIKIRYGDVQGWTKAIQFMAENKNIAVQMGVNARTYAEKNWNLDVFVKEIVSILKELNTPGKDSDNIMNSENSKRIAKNTTMLYFRMLLTMLISLYTVRVVLNTLGVVDYGIYNVVGGVVMMFSFLSNTMASASQRFFAFELGRNDLVQLKRTFSMTLISYSIISLIVLVLAETAGLWFLNTQMNIPSGRMEAANWIYQFAIFSFIVRIMTVPYNAAIIAHENMTVYAYVSVFEVAMKLLNVYMLVWFSFDKLKLYAVLTFATTGIVTFIYRDICKKKYKECRFHFFWDKGLFNTLLSYCGWNLFGAVAGIMNNQGINILLNLFFGPVVNAARAIAYQINTAMNQFVMNFHTAVKPQITKYYATGEKREMMSLVFKSSKYSYYLLFILSMPVLLETEYILSLWLKNVPEYTILFTRLVILNALIDSLSYSLMTAAQATGKIKQYQSVVGGMMLMTLPVSYLFLRWGYLPQITLYVTLVVSFICLILRLFMLKNMIGLSVRNYSREVLMAILAVSGIAYVIPSVLLFQLEFSLFRFVTVSAAGIISSVAAIYSLGLSGQEQQFVRKMMKEKIIRNVHKEN